MEHNFNINIAKLVGIEEAIILNNFRHWHLKNKANEKNYFEGRYWTYNSIKALCEIFCYMNKNKISYAINKLVDNGFLIKGNFNENKYDRTTWYSINEELINKYVSENPYSKNEKSISENSEMEDEKIRNGVCENQKSNTDIKTNINSNIKTDNNTPPQKKSKSKKEVEVIEEKFPFGEHQNVKLSLDEKEKLLQRWGADVFQQIVDKLSNYKLSSGTKYKSDYGAINNWVAKQVEKDNRFSKPLNNNNNGNSQSKSGKQYFNLEPGWSNLTGDEWWMRPYTYTGGDGENDNVPK